MEVQEEAVNIQLSSFNSHKLWANICGFKYYLFFHFFFNEGRGEWSLNFKVSLVKSIQLVSHLKT